MHHDKTLRRPPPEGWTCRPDERPHTRRRKRNHWKERRKNRQCVSSELDRLVGNRSVNGTARSVACLDIGYAWKSDLESLGKDGGELSIIQVWYGVGGVRH